MKSIHTKLQDITQEYFSNHDVEAQEKKFDKIKEHYIKLFLYIVLT
jgi:hypothetical protein